MRFLFTMSDMERPAASCEARLPSTLSKRNARLKNETDQNRIERIFAPAGAACLSRPPGSPSIQDYGGARRDRTDDLMLAKHALSQLSYGPVSRPAGAQVVVGLGGLEPPTSRLSSARSNQLSYKPPVERRSPAPAQAFKAGRDASLPYPYQKERRRRRGPAKCGLTGPLDSEPDDKPSDKSELKSSG
jgi:hypothetical protein